jgi:hypothetical protein
MKHSGGQVGEADDFRGFDNGQTRGALPPPYGEAGAMGGVERPNFSGAGVGQVAEDFSETVATIAHGQQAEGIAATGGAPAPCDGAGGVMRRQRTFEFVGGNQDAH